MSASLDDRLALTAGGQGSAGTGVVEFRAVFPAVPEAVSAVRAYVGAVGGDGDARAGEVELIASELASCAVRETLGGVFTVTVQRRPGWLRVEVASAGSGWWPTGDGEDAVAYGLGLGLIAGVAERFGSYGVSGGAGALWAEVEARVGR